MITKNWLPWTRLKDFIKCISTKKRYFVFDKENQEYLNDKAQNIKDIISMLDVLFHYEEDYNQKILFENPKLFIKNAWLELQLEKSFIA